MKRLPEMVVFFCFVYIYSVIFYNICFYVQQ